MLYFQFSEPHQLNSKNDRLNEKEISKRLSEFITNSGFMDTTFYNLFVWTTE